MADRTDIVKIITGSFRGVTTLTDVDAAMARMLKRTKLVFQLAADGGTSANLSETPIGSALAGAFTDGFRVISATLTPGTAKAASDTNYETFTLKKRDGAGGAATTVATATTQATGGAALVAFSPFALTLTGSAADLAAGGVLTFTKTKTGSGSPLDTGAVLEVIVEAL